MKTLLRILVLTLLCLPGLAGAVLAGPAHQFQFTSIDGEPLPFSSFKGRPVLVVNTASFCGYTYQYDGLQKLYDTYRDRGLVVLGVPSNDFGGQEPGSEKEIKEFCEVNFSIDFPLTEKQVVRGKDAHPMYRWLGNALGRNKLPRWNFYKYLIDGDGQVVASWSNRTKPMSKDIRRAVEMVLVE